MKGLLAITMVLILCAGLSGCISIQSADAEPTGSFIEASAPASGSADATEQSSTDESSAVPQDGRLPGLSAHYPWERVPLPEGSEFIEVSGMEDTDKYVEYTDIRLPMTKTEAVAYFQPLLEKDVDFFKLDADLDYVPLEIQGAYPDAVSCTSLYARYTAETEPNIHIINVSLYTPADGEMVLVAVVQVNYHSKPE
jgi:hypothetical protein